MTQPDAFELLRATARSSRRRIGDVANEVLASGGPTPTASGLAPRDAPARPRRSGFTAGR
jgi:hypothetical protein